MSEGIADIDVSVGEGGTGGIDAGDTRVGRLTGAQMREANIPGEDEPVPYFDMTLEDTEVPFEFTVGFSMGSDVNDPTITPNTQLGHLVERMGATIEPNESLNLGDVFSVGQTFEFEVEENDDGYLDIDKETFRPEGEDPVETDSSEESGSDDSGGDLRQRVLEVVEENEGDSPNQVKAALSNLEQAGAAITLYNELADEGEITVENDSVFL